MRALLEVILILALSNLGALIVLAWLVTGYTDRELNRHKDDDH